MKRAANVTSDALREAMGVGTTAALSSLVKMTGGEPWRRGLTEHVPITHLESVATGDLAAMGACITVRIGGTLGGLFTILFDAASAKMFTDALLGRRATGDTPSEMSDSALCEACNIAACAFGIAVQARAAANIAPSTPELNYGELAPTLLQAGAAYNAAFALTCQFLSASGDIAGRIVWLLAHAEQTALARMLEPASPTRLGGV